MCQSEMNNLTEMMDDKLSINKAGVHVMYIRIYFHETEKPLRQGQF
jgi:hypothetical protein